MPVIRSYRPADAAPIAQLFHASVHRLGALRYGPAQLAAWSPAVREASAWAAVCSDGRTVLVAVDAHDMPQGFVTLEADGHVDHLYRHPDGERGLGAALLDAAIANAAGLGIGRLHTEASDLARGVFARKGFRLLARRDVEHRGVAIHNWAMARRL